MNLRSLLFCSVVGLSISPFGICAEWEREQVLEINYRAFEELEEESLQTRFLEDANSASLELDLNGKSSFSNSVFKYDLKARYDGSLDERSYFLLRELWLEHEYPHINLAVGQKIYNLKKFEGPDLLDNLSPIVLDSSIIDPTKKGLPFVGFNFEINGNEIRFEWLPIFVGNTFPDEKSRIGTATNYTEKFYDGSTETDKDAADRYFFSWKTYWEFIEGLETNFNFTRQVDARSPILTLGNGDLVFNYFEFKQYSFDWIKPFESWILKGMLIRKEYDKRSKELETVRLQDHDSAGVGVEIPFYFFEGLETTVFAEYTKLISGGEVPVEELSLLQNDYFIGVRQALPGFRSPEFTVGVLKDFDFQEEEIYSFEFEMRVFDSSKFYLEAVKVNSDPKTRKNALNLNTLSLYEHYDYAQLGLKLFF